MKPRLSPEAKARLEAARAIAQGKPAPAPGPSPGTGSRPAGPAKDPGPGAAGATAGPTAAGSAKGPRLALAALGGIVLLAGTALAARLLAGGRPDLVGSTAAIQKGLLEGTVDDSARRKAVAEVIRNADQMTKPELDEARKSLEEEWRRSRDEAILAFFDAPEGERSRLADEGIDRTLAYRKLRFGLSPQAVEEGGRKQKPPKDDDRKKLFLRYAEALQTQAKKRGITLPEWQ